MVARLVVVLVAALFGLALSESALRMLVDREQLYEPTDEEFWRARLARSIEAHDGHALGPQADIQPDAQLGWRMKADYRKGAVRHNSRGFRDAREFTEHHDGRRILAIGASMVYGLGVDQAQLMTTLLEQASGAETIDAGVNAYGADQALLLWEHDGPMLGPDVVVFVYHVDDFYRNGLRVRDLPKPYFVPDDGGFRLAGVPVPSAEALAASGDLDAGVHLRIAEAAGWLYRKTSYKLRGEPERLAQLTRLDHYILQRMRDSVRAANAHLIVVVTGHCFDGVPRYAASEDAIVDSCRELGIDVIDLVPVMREKGYESYFGDNCHWSPAGHALAAEKVDEALASH